MPDTTLDGLAEFIIDNGYSFGRETKTPGYFAFVLPTITGNGRLAFGTLVALDDAYCYSSVEKAIESIEEWFANGQVGEPYGWHRHIQTGRRRPGGDKMLEYVNL